MKFNKLAFAVIGAASLVAAGPAAADLYPDFTINPTPYSGAAPFTADKITGNYAEVATFNPDGTMSVSLKWEAGQFVMNDGITPINAGTTGLGVGYNLYALFQGVGSFTTSGSASSFNLSSGTMTLWLDDDANTTFAAPATGLGVWTLGNAGDDKLLATGAAVNGAGNVNCTVGLNCGSFGQTTTLTLTPTDGSTFFAAPNPFYGITLQAGQLNGFLPSGTLNLNGSLDVVFAPTPVPEPGSLALVGIALAGLGALRRKKA